MIELCSSCMQELKQIKWNEKCAILICANVGCPLFHTPQGSILVEDPLYNPITEETNGGETKESRSPKGKGKGRKPKAKRRVGKARANEPQLAEVG